MAHATGASPPVNDNDDEYASPMTADGVGQAVITNPPPTITSNWRSPWLPAESATRAVMRKVPEALGVPPICPVAEFRLNPAGRAPALIVQLRGGAPPDASKVEL